MGFKVVTAAYNPKHNAIGERIRREFKTFDGADAYMKYLTETRHLPVMMCVPGMELAHNYLYWREYAKVVD